MEQPDARSQFQAPIEERGLSLELREIARQGRHTPKPREHQATGALSNGRRAFGHEVIQRSDENTVGGASIGQSGMAHTSAFSPMEKLRPLALSRHSVSRTVSGSKLSRYLHRRAARVPAPLRILRATMHRMAAPNITAGSCGAIEQDRSQGEAIGRRFAADRVMRRRRRGRRRLLLIRRINAVELAE